MKILLTGFEPFHNETTNPSYDAIKNLKIGNTTILTLRLPVVYEECFSILEKEIQSFHPDYVFCFGLASGRKYITPELNAINYLYSTISDNHNTTKKGEKISPNGENSYFTQINLPIIVEELNQKEDCYRLSVSAGSYVCNNLYYRLLQNENKYHYKGLFIHVPNTNDMELEKTTILCERLIQHILDHSIQ